MYARVYLERSDCIHPCLSRRSCCTPTQFPLLSCACLSAGLQRGGRIGSNGTHLVPDGEKHPGKPHVHQELAGSAIPLPAPCGREGNRDSGKEGLPGQTSRHGCDMAVKDMASHFLCPVDMSKVPCGIDGEGYRFGETRGWVKKLSPVLQVRQVLLWHLARCLSLFF